MSKQVTWKRGPGKTRIGTSKCGTYVLTEEYVRGTYGSFFWHVEYNGRAKRWGSGQLFLAKARCENHAERMAKRAKG